MTLSANSGHSEDCGMGLAPPGKVSESDLKLLVRPRDGRPQQIACWHLETKEQKPVWGEHANGYIVLATEGRWIVVQTELKAAKHHKPTKNEQPLLGQCWPIPENTEPRETRL